ncbi:MAG TPA: hypothetical protein VLJ39_00375 [Tepidisphaeraceae bacterium]|nr:hypothetical protein [Tepidisphaeraceae bacterium]
MSVRKGLTSWVIVIGGLKFAYRWNMSLREAVHTFGVHRGAHRVLTCGPMILEWR